MTEYKTFKVGDILEDFTQLKEWCLTSQYKLPFTIVGVGENGCLGCTQHPQNLTVEDSEGNITTFSGFYFDVNELFHTQEHNHR